MTFDATRSAAPASTITAYEWTIDGAVSTGSSPTLRSSFSPAAYPASCRFALRVRNADGAWSAPAAGQVTVNMDPCPANPGVSRYSAACASASRPGAQVCPTDSTITASLADGCPYAYVGVDTVVLPRVGPIVCTPWGQMIRCDVQRAFGDAGPAMALAPGGTRAEARLALTVPGTVKYVTSNSCQGTTCAAGSTEPVTDPDDMPPYRAGGTTWSWPSHDLLLVRQPAGWRAHRWQNGFWNAAATVTDADIQNGTVFHPTVTFSCTGTVATDPVACPAGPSTRDVGTGTGAGFRAQWVRP